MEAMDYAKVKNKVIKPKKRVAGETGPELSSDEEPRAQFIIVRNRKKPKKSSDDGVKQSSNVICSGTETRSSDCWLLLFQSSPVVTTRNYYTFKIAVIVTHKVFNSLLYKTSATSSTVDMFGASGIHLQTANH
jgi:hypothetical protein